MKKILFLLSFILLSIFESCGMTPCFAQWNKDLYDYGTKSNDTVYLAGTSFQHYLADGDTAFCHVFGYPVSDSEEFAFCIYKSSPNIFVIDSVVDNYYGTNSAVSFPSVSGVVSVTVEYKYNYPELIQLELGAPGSGTVTSVGLSLPGIFSVSGSPVTTSGTLTATLASQTANKVFVSPNGSSGAPTFRALVATDIPSLSYEPVITAGTAAQYLRGDKSWQTLDNAAVGLGNVTNNLQLTAANNLSDLVSTSTARTNLGLGSSATHASSDYFLVANNLSEGTAATMRTNLGLGTSAVQNVSYFLQTANNLSDVTASTARTNLGLGTSATHPATDFALSGANTDITSVLLNQTGLVVKGGDANALTIKPNETMTAARTLNLKVNDVSRTIDLSGNLTVSGAATISGTNTGDQDLSGYVPTSRTVNGHALSSNVTVTAGDLSLGSVENTALSTWPGTTNVTTLGTIGTGVWNGTAIAYSKLSLTGAILNADLAGSIAYSKLSLTGAILNADLAGSIAYSKLSLTGAIVNGDLVNSGITIQGSSVALGGSTLATNSTPQFGRLGLNQAADGTASLAMTQAALGTTSTDGIIMKNTTASTGSVTQQYSPRFLWCGTAWNSSGSASETDKAIIELQPQTVAGTTTANLITAFSIAGGSYATKATLTSGGALTISGALSASNFSGTSSGTNTGDQSTVSGNAGSATILQTTRSIYGNNFDGSAALSQIIASTYGGTGNGFTKFSGPASSEKTFTLPNASATVLTDNAAVTVAQGGIGVGTLAVNGVLYGNTTSAVQALAVNSTATNKFLTQSSSNAPAWAALVSGDIPNNAANTTGSAATLTTARTINGLSFNGSANVSGNFTAGGTGSGFTVDLVNSTMSGVLPIANGGELRNTAATSATTGTISVTMNTRFVTITPTGACTFNATGGTTGQTTTFFITTSGTSSFTLTWGTNFKPTGTLATGTTSGKIFLVTFITANGTAWNEMCRTTAE